MKKPVQRVAAIHDLSGFGRASLTVIMPILSNMGCQVCPVPTAILSTHTGGFPGYHFVDLTEHMEAYLDHWSRLDLSFDAIYSGFLGSEKQIQIVANCIDRFATIDTLSVVDPVMGDDGKLYGTMSNMMVDNMRKLVQKADIITPNFTEAAFLLGKEVNSHIHKDDIKDWLIQLAEMGPKMVIMTSVPDIYHTDQTSVIAYDRDHEVFWKVCCKYIPTYYPGTGDIFTSVLLGSLLNGDSLPIALDRGVQFVSSSIKASYGFNYPEREGVLLERVLDSLKMPVVLSSYELYK